MIATRRPQRGNSQGPCHCGRVARKANLVQLATDFQDTVSTMRNRAFPSIILA
jgi:hypothetical protein